MDVEIGRLLEGLQALDLADNTLIAFIGDHGEEFLDHGRTWHGHTLYGELVNVPLLLWWPGGVPAGVTVDETVRSIDLMPTLLALSGLTAPRRIQGQSLLPLMGTPAGRRRRGPRNGLHDWRGLSEISATDGLSRSSPMAGSWYRILTFQMRNIRSSSSLTTVRIRWTLSMWLASTPTSSSVSPGKSSVGSVKRKWPSYSQTRSLALHCPQKSSHVSAVSDMCGRRTMSGDCQDPRRVWSGGTACPCLRLPPQRQLLAT